MNYRTDKLINEIRKHAGKDHVISRLYLPKELRLGFKCSCGLEFLSTMSEVKRFRVNFDNVDFIFGNKPADEDIFLKYINNGKAQKFLCFSMTEFLDAIMNKS